MNDKLCKLLNIDQLNKDDSTTFLISRHGFNEDKDDSTSCCVGIDENEKTDDSLPPNTIQNVSVFLNRTESVNYQVNKQPEQLPAFIDIINTKRKKGTMKEPTKHKENEKKRLVSDNPNVSLFSEENIVTEIIIEKD